LAAAFLKRKLLNHEVTLLYIWYKAGEERRAWDTRAPFVERERAGAAVL
jgi:hypothetical protein